MLPELPPEDDRQGVLLVATKQTCGRKKRPNGRHRTTWIRSLENDLAPLGRIWERHKTELALSSGSHCADPRTGVEFVNVDDDIYHVQDIGQCLKLPGLKCNPVK